MRSIVPSLVSFQLSTQTDCYWEILGNQYSGSLNCVNRQNELFKFPLKSNESAWPVCLSLASKYNKLLEYTGRLRINVLYPKGASWLFMQKNGKPPNAESVQPDIHMLISQFHDSVYRYSYRLTGRQADAEDVTQQTFLIAHEKLAQLKSPSSAKSWLMTIARNCFLKRLRCKQAIPASNLDIDVDQIDQPDLAPQPEDELDPNALKQAIAELEPNHRLIIMMFYFEKLSYKEISEQLEVKIGTVMSRLSRAKFKLREAMLRQGSSHERRIAQ